MEPTPEVRMVLYEYRCERHGDIEVLMPMGSAPGSIPCDACGAEARRVYTVPSTSHPRRDIVTAIEHAEKSAYEPETVTSLPAAGRHIGKHRPTPMAPPNPAFDRLPRP
jgi:putative FmdB family regulatory protein